MPKMDMLKPYEYRKVRIMFNKTSHTIPSNEWIEMKRFVGLELEDWELLLEALRIAHSNIEGDTQRRIAVLRTSLDEKLCKTPPAGASRE